MPVEHDYCINSLSLFSVRVQIAEVTDAMRDNVGRLLERGDQLDQLQDRSQGLATSSDQFRTSANRVRRNAWWHNTRTKLVIGVAVALVFLIIISECSSLLLKSIIIITYKAC